jgi:hypothetical protein
VYEKQGTEITDLRNILLMNRSLFTGFLFLPLGVSVHIYAGMSTLSLRLGSIAYLFHVLQDLSQRRLSIR